MINVIVHYLHKSLPINLDFIYLFFQFLFNPFANIKRYWENEANNDRFD